jgi:FRG domain
MPKRNSDSVEEWNRVLQEIRAAGKALEQRSKEFFDLWYRGSSRSSYSLLPSLFRGYRNPNRKKTWHHIWGHEQDLYWEFASRARQLHGKVDNDWDILFTMRHYGVPTRILDWTETFGVAVFMALHDFGSGMSQPTDVDDDDPPCVWVLNPYELNRCSLRHEDPTDLFDPKNLGWNKKEKAYYGYSELLLEPRIGWGGPIAVYPQQRSDRMQAQRGWFTIHGDDFSPIDQRKDKDTFLRKVAIPSGARKAALEFLKEAGLELFVLFPDLAGLAEHLTRLHAAEREKFR